MWEILYRDKMEKKAISEISNGLNLCSSLEQKIEKLLLRSMEKERNLERDAIIKNYIS
jgi:hypothetical protein